MNKDVYIQINRENLGVAEEAMKAAEQLQKQDREALMAFLQGVAFGRGLASGEGRAV